MPFNAPAPPPNLPIAQSGQCDEKRAGDFTYPQPCSNHANHVIGFAPNSFSPNARINDFRWQICVVRHQRHPAGFHVCRYCVAAAENEHWFKLATAYIRKKPPAGAENNSSRHYLTRLCRLCEHREETLLSQLAPNSIHGAPNRIPPQILPTQFARSFMANWPRNRCTCEKKGLYMRVRCHPHRRDFWDRVRARNVTAKRHNKNYLINTKRNGGERQNSTAEEREDRLTDGLWRACRCGEDPVATTAEATVMQCMACEGIVHFDIIQGGPQPAFGTPPAVAPTPLEVSQNSLTTPDLFTITGDWGDDRRLND